MLRAQPRGSVPIGGFLTVLLGLLAMMTPFVSGIAVTMVVATVITAAGIAITMYAFKAVSFGRGLAQFLFGGITMLCGIASIVLAILMWRQWPATGAFAVGLLLGIRLIFTG